MEEYEVDLRDYFQVMWEKKWIILGVFLAAIVLALLLSFRMPNKYETEALVQLNDLPRVAGIQVQAPSPQMVLVILQSRDLLARTAEEANLAEEDTFQGLSQQQVVESLRENLEATIPEGTSLIKTKLAGALDPQLLNRILNEHLRVLGEKLTEQASSDAEQEVARVSDEIGILEGQRDGLIEEIEEEIAERKAILGGQREVLLQQLNAIEQNREKLGLPAGEQNATLEGLILKQQFIALNSRVQQIERELDDLERRGREQFPELNSRIQGFDRQIEDLQISAEKARQLLSPSWQPLYIVDQPSAPAGAIAPNRKMNVAVGGVLGLFVGVLLAFFVHYMEGSKQVQRAEE